MLCYAQVRRFVRASRALHPPLANMSLVVHASEEAALAALLRPAGERVWALIVFRSLEPRRVDYAIRMNYSSLPNTNWVVRWIARGLDTRYTRYHLSGFLTLQATRPY